MKDGLIETAGCGAGRPEASYADAARGISGEDFLKSKSDAINALRGELKYIDCPKCRNKGYVTEVKNGAVAVRECSCMPARRVMRNMEHSGLKNVISRYRFDTFATAEPWQAEMKSAAERYAAEKRGWLVVTGCPGSGKTHICTAVCGALLKAGIPVRYFLWRAEAPVVKACANDASYAEKTRELREIKCLYIDDFWKGSVSGADKNLAFDILNSRYNNIALLTVISSELSLGQIMEMDQATGSRIFERSAVVDARGRNMRLARSEK